MVSVESEEAAVDSHPATELPRGVWRNLAMDVSLASAIGLMAALVATLLPPLARQAGMGVGELSILAAVPYLGAVVALAAPRFGPRLPRQMFLPVALGALPAVLLVASPSQPAIILTAFTVSTGVLFLMPYQVRLWAEIYPDDRRGRFISILGIARIAAGAVGVAAGGILASLVGGPAAVAACLALCVLLACASFGFTAEAIERAPRRGIRDTVGHFLEARQLWRLATAQIVWGLGTVAAVVLIPFVQIDRLGLTLADVGLIALLAAIAGIASYPAWGWLADRRGGLPVLIGASFLGASGIACWALAEDISVALLGTGLLALAEAGLGIGQPIALTERSDPDEVVAHQSAWIGLVGLRGMVAPFLLVVPLGLGWIDVRGGLLLCASASLAGSLLFLRARLQPDEVATALAGAD